MAWYFNPFSGKLDYYTADDTAYGASWDGDTTKAPSKNAVYDKINSMYDGLLKITVGSSAPTSPSTGDLWVDTS